MSTHLIAGLGNPGPKYVGHRHNVGFMVVDELARRWGAPSFRDKFKGEFTKVSVGHDEVILLKPMTFMNLSGEAVQAAFPKAADLATALIRKWSAQDAKETLQ